MIQVAVPSENLTTPGLKLAACLLLAGSLRPSPLTAAARSSVLDLYITPTESVLDVWLRQFEAIASLLSQKPIVNVIYSVSSHPPKSREGGSALLDLRFEEDPQQFRGPAGAVRDACSVFDADSTIIVAEAARYVSGDLTRLIAEHVEHGADITVACNEDSTPAGLFVIRRSTLDLVPKKGFTDLKEQWLKKAVESGLNVRVHRLRGSYSYELRTREGFLQAAEASGGLTSPTICATGNVALIPTDVPEAMHTVAEGVAIGPRAVIVESVVMPGAHIGENAVIARSIVCPGAKVPAGGTVIDGVVSASEGSVG